MKDHLSFLVKRSNTTGGRALLFRSAVYGLSGLVKLNVGRLVIWLQEGWLVHWCHLFLSERLWTLLWSAAFTEAQAPVPDIIGVARSGIYNEAFLNRRQEHGDMTRRGQRRGGEGADKGNTEIEVDRDATHCSARMCVCMCCLHGEVILLWRLVVI